MRGIFKKSAVFLLALAFALPLTACAKKPDDTDKGNGNSVKIEQSDVLLASYGKTDYRIVVPADADETLMTAASELERFFEEATGAKPATVTDKNVVYTESAKYLSLGKNKLTLGAGITQEDNLGKSGFNIFTKGNTVFMLGNTSVAALYAAQDFMHYTFGYEAYSGDCVRVNKTDTLYLKKLTVRSVPSFENRVASTTYMWRDPAALRRLRWTNPADWFINCGNDVFATTLDIIPAEKYLESNPEYYRRKPNENGELEVAMIKNSSGKIIPAEVNFTNREMWKVALERMKELILENPDKDTIMFGQMDVKGWDESPETKAETEKYGGVESSSVVLCINYLASEIRSWINEVQPGRTIKVGMFAYLNSRNAPVKKNADGKYEPIAPEMVLDDDAFVMLAPIETDYRYSYNDPANPNANRECTDAIEGWGAVCDEVFLWGYDVNFCHFLIPFNCYNTLQDMYRFYKKNNCASIFNEGLDGGVKEGTAFADLRNYLEAKLSWDVDADVNALIADFMDGMYGAAAKQMTEYYNGMIELTTHNYFNNSGLNGEIYLDIEQAKFWPKGTLDRWIELIDEGIAAIEPLKASEPKRYAAIKGRLEKERLSPMYMVITLYPTYYTATELRELKLSFRELERKNPLGTAREFNGKNDGKGISMDELYRYWEIL